MFKRILLSLLFILLLGAASNAQTLVSGTVTDGDSQTWNNGSITFTSSGLGVSAVTGTLSTTGTYTNLSISHSAATAAVGEIWKVTVCPQFNFPCFSQTSTISGATQTLNLTPAAIRINVLGPYQSQPAAYLDAEVINAYIGFEYFNVTSGVYRSCGSLSGGNCVWANNPGNATSTNCNVNSVSPAACASAAAGVVVVPTTTTTYTVNTTAVTANSRIQVWVITDNSGVTGAPTCNASVTPFIATPSARVAGTSFTFTLPSITGTSCWNYIIIN